MKKRAIAWLTVLVMLLSLMPQIAFAGEASAALEGNLLKVTTTADFEAGQLTGLELAPGEGNGAVVLEDGATEGVFVSQIYDTDAFARAVASWNAAIFEGGKVEIWAQARQDGQWSDWLSWGPYTPFATRGSEDNKGGNFVTMDQDVFYMDAGTGDGVRVKAVLTRTDADVESPILRQVALTFNGGDMEPTYAEEAVELPLEALVTAPAYAQGIRHPSIGGSICSPTTMTVLMNSRDPELDLLPEELALNVQDEGEGIFGNWSFSVSGAGLYGFESYAHYGSKDILMQELAQGRVVGISVSYQRPDQTGSYPVLDGAYSSTGGHLITIIGYEYEDGVRDDDHLYFYSSDSYSAGDATSYHRYKWTQLKEAWGAKCMSYIIPEIEREEGVTVTGVERTYASLEMDPYDKTAFAITVDGEMLDMERFVSGGGLLGYTVEGFTVDMINGLIDSDVSVDYPNSMQVTANDVFYYNLSCNEDGTVSLDTNTILRDLDIPYGEAREITVYAMSDRGTMYIASADISIYAEEVVVVPSENVPSATVTTVTDSKGVHASIAADEIIGDTVAVGLLMPDSAQQDRLTVKVNGETVSDLSVWNNADGAAYLVVNVPADVVNNKVQVDWTGRRNVTTYFLDMAGTTMADEVVVVEGNVTQIDLEAGRTSGKTVVNKDGSLALADGETYAEYYSPVYDSFDWEYAMSSINAYLPGTSSVDLQIRAYTQRGECWSDWYSFGKLSAGDISTSISMKDTNVNMDTDVFTMRGSSSIANAMRYQARIVLRGDGEEQPAVYHASFTYKKSAYDAAEAVHIGETAVEGLPASAGKDIDGYSAYAYASGMSAWRFENLELMLLNGQGSDLLFEEVALGGYDRNAGWGNWNMTNYKPSLFGHRAYSQFGANSTLVQQALADGYLVGLYVHGGRVPGTNSSSTSQTLVHSYYTAEDGTVMFKLICPRGDTGELRDGDVYGEISAADLDTAISDFGSDSVRGLMYLVGQKEYASSWQRVEAEAVMNDAEHTSFTMTVDGDELIIPAEWDYGEFGQGVLAYTLASETDPEAKLAAGEFYYSGFNSNGDGTFTVTSKMMSELETYGAVRVYVIFNNGITYTATLEHYHTWDEGVVTKEPGLNHDGECTYTCTACGKTYIEVIPAKDVTPEGPGLGDRPSKPEKPDSKLPFTDVSEKDPYYENIVYVYEKGLMNGVSGTAFDVNGTLTRAMVLTTLYRLEGEPAILTAANFTDVADGMWYTNAIAWGAANGIVNGYGNGSFGPNDALTREQLMAILYRYAQFKAYDVSVGESTNILSYVDFASISEYAIAAMQWACGADVIEDAAGMLTPKANATRGQVAYALHMFLENVMN